MKEKDKITPLMKQYSQIKRQYPDTVLLFRMGDFFETFDDDAVLTSKACGIVLTKRNSGYGADQQLAGFPHHQLDNYLPKLIKAGYRVAVCEQLEDPKLARGIVKRGVVEVVTPGVVMYDKLLDNKYNNYLACLVIKMTKDSRKIAAIAAADISTGEFFTGEFGFDKLAEVLENIMPSELIVNKAQFDEIESELKYLSFQPSLTKLEHWFFDEEFAREALKAMFKTQSLKGFGLEDLPLAITAAGAVMHYIKETQTTQITHFKRISVFNPSEYMTLDYSTRRNLEITYSMNDSSKEGTLISIMDKTNCPMGSRLFKKWLTRPLCELKPIKRRLSVVRALFDDDYKRKQIREYLSQIADLERLISKISTGRANPREVVALKNSLKILPDLKMTLAAFESDELKNFAGKINPLNDVFMLIEQSLTDEPTSQLGTGNVFKRNYSEELDSYIDAKYSGKNWVSDYREKEREKTGITTLKVDFNNVFGYYIEVTHAQKSKVPEYYERKQTLTNAERYTTPELKEIETKILNSEEKISELEQYLFAQLRMKIALSTEDVQTLSNHLAALDCLQSFAQASKEYDYVEPQIDEGTSLQIIEGRHPIVERLLPIGQRFVPNSTKLSPDSEQIHIITGPNMSGKSCYLRQVGLIVLLGQIGCFVPAVSAKFGLVDRIFTRVGAQDNITAGESTFLVEMQEAANILNNASGKSLILLDEIGRGTATFDGISIAWAISEYIHDRIGAKTLFATHYHELNDLENKYPRIINYKVEVIETGGTVIFAHRVKKGGSDHSFGIHVAQMAGLPFQVVDRANEILKLLEKSSKTQGNGSEIITQNADISSIDVTPTDKQGQLAIFEYRDDEIRNRIGELELKKITPEQALILLKQFQIEIKNTRKKR